MSGKSDWTFSVLPQPGAFWVDFQASCRLQRPDLEEHERQVWCARNDHTASSGQEGDRLLRAVSPSNLYSVFPGRSNRREQRKRSVRRRQSRLDAGQSPALRVRSPGTDALMTSPRVLCYLRFLLFRAGALLAFPRMARQEFRMVSPARQPSNSVVDPPLPPLPSHIPWTRQGRSCPRTP